MSIKATFKASQTEEVVGFFCRHLVGLCVAYKHKTPEDAPQPPRFAPCSGTLIVIHDVVCFLTAGHVLRMLDELRNSEKIEITGASLADTFGLRPISDIPIPFDLMNARLFYIDDEEEGLDFGVIMLEPCYIRLLTKNGIVALNQERWIHQSKIIFDGYAVLGFPEELTQDRVSALGAATVTAVLCGVKKLDSLPDGRSPTRFPQFVGQLVHTSSPKSVKGMSGGPIIGFRQEPDGNFHYWIVALQSSWDSKSRVIYGTSLPALASLMTEWGAETSSAA